jgi:hypothetical protein
MMIDQKKDIAFYEAQPELFTVTNGAVRSKANGQIVAMYPERNPYAITKENSHHLHMLRKTQGVKSALMGLIDAAREDGIDLPAPGEMSDEELITAGGDALRLFSKHMAKTFLKSGNLRGMGEVYSKLTAPYILDPREREAEREPFRRPADVSIAQMVVNILGDRDPTKENIIDAQIEYTDNLEQEIARRQHEARK